MLEPTLQLDGNICQEVDVALVETLHMCSLVCSFAAVKGLFIGSIPAVCSC